MSMNLRYPNITGGSEREQVAQIRGYLHQLVEQLNYVLSNLSAGDGSANSDSTNKELLSEAQYYELRSMIANETREIRGLIDQLSTKLQSEYVTKEEMQTAIAALSEPAADT